ncbi:carbohydrate diacid regulator [Bacillus sp. FJAT-42376]|uniref:CdaR family transcriptional regulator n=1 Tax=Bacillus sp. FJAT-42376 TaxID=2014076 RepID=UPI000F50CD55|nr:sugar diacid recognition domain-containing protein [Bacillus sp. FJAT-42376]AZB42106.1 carbohydrate diacid regulator [Bacillus sp. FJAT-42376]
MLLPALAAKIVEEVKKVIEEDVIVVTPEGTIIASTDDSRMGDFHEGAKMASREKRKVIISKEDEQTLAGVKAGINLPVFFQGEVAGVIGITGIPENISPFGEVIRKMTELLVNENYYTDQLNWEARTREAFVFDWIELKKWTPSFMDRAQMLNVDLTVPRMAAIAVLPDEDLHFKHIASVIQTWQNSYPADLFVQWGNNRIVMVFQAGDKAYARSRAAAIHEYLEEKLQTRVLMGAGKAVPSADLSASYAQAERALNSPRGKQRIIFDEDLTIEMLLGDISSETKKEYIERTLAPMLPEEDLLRTLIVLFEMDHSLKKTAEALHIHINTLHYRLKKIEDLTGLNPSRLNDALILYLAVIFMDKHPK